MEGTWIYQVSTLRIWITLHDTWYGTGDREDAKEIQIDRKIPTYYIWLEPAGGGTPQCCGQFLSLDEALAKVSSLHSTWKSTENPYFNGAAWS